LEVSQTTREYFAFRPDLYSSINDPDKKIFDEQYLETLYASTKRIIMTVEEEFRAIKENMKIESNF
jgi:hypothetical protein